MEKILLTGASSGIGFAIAKKLSEAGYNLICTVRKEQDKTRLENLNNKIVCEILDVTDEKAIDSLYTKLKAENIKLTAIINNAGFAETGLMEQPDIESIKKQLEVNSFAPLRLATTMLPLMEHGKIINMSSVSANFVYPFLVPYCASKRLLDIFFHGMALEMGDKDIKIVSIKPGIIKTPIWDKSISAAKSHFEKFPNSIKKKYQPMMEDLLNQLEKSIKNGLEPNVVASCVLKAIKSKNPKGSYNIGAGSYVGDFLGKLNVDIQKKLVQLRFLNKFI